MRATASRVARILAIAPPGIEPGLFASRVRRVASYTKGHRFRHVQIPLSTLRPTKLVFSRTKGNPERSLLKTPLVQSPPALTRQPNRVAWRARSVLAAIAVTVSLGACRSAALPFGGTTPGGRERVEHALTALYERYANIHHGVHYEHARQRLAATALVPSRAFNDSSIWTSFPDSTTRRLELGEFVTPAGFTEQETADSVPFPSKLGDARHTIVLRHLPDGDYRWDTNVAIAFGTIRAADVADGIVALLTAATERPEAQLRADYHSTFPHTTAVLGQLFALDSLIALSAPEHDGSLLVNLHFSLHPDGLQTRYPAFAAYMRKYVGPTHYSFHIADQSGVDYFRASSDGPPVIVQARVRGREFLPLGGGERPLPDSLVLAGRFTTKIKIFTVGVKQFSSHFIIGRSAHERSWTLRLNRQPDWKLPLATAHLLSSPLARPFQGEGMMYRVAVRDTAGAQTILTRTAHGEVHESTMMNFIGGLISRVILDQDGEVQKQEFQFYGDVFDAMRRDFGTLLAPSGGG